MVTSAIIAPGADVLNVKADSYDKLAGYASFRAIQDDWVEPPRASIDDVESVAAVLRDSLELASGQDYRFSTASAPSSGMVQPVRAGASPDDEKESRAFGSSLELSGLALDEGRTHQLILSPGTLRLTSFDARARAATEERALLARASKTPPACSACPLFAFVPVPVGGSGAEVKEWSRKSRLRMVETLAALDYSTWLRCGGTLAMLTLTLPGNWEILAPSGAAFKLFVRNFQKRWERSRSAPLVRVPAPWDSDKDDKWAVDPASRLEWRGLWKLEFQRRGAPHWHGLVRLPVFIYSAGGYNSKLGYEVKEMAHEFISRTWADVVGASKEVDGMDSEGNDTSEYLRHLAAGTGIDFSGKDFSDPRRISMYFLGHSAKSTDGKEYQHWVPKLWQEGGKGPGRFWGVCGLNKALARVTVTDADLVRLKRIARKVKAARDWRVAVLREQGAALKSGAAVPGAFSIGDAVRLNKKSPGRLGRAAHRTRNRKALEANQLGYKDVPPAVGIGPVRRVSTLVLVPPAYQEITKDGRIGEGPDNLVRAPWVPQKRASYKPFSNGQGGFVLVNDGLQLGLDIARYLGSL